MGVEGSGRSSGVLKWWFCSHCFLPSLCSCLVLLMNGFTWELNLDLGGPYVPRSKGCQCIKHLVQVTGWSGSQLWRWFPFRVLPLFQNGAQRPCSAAFLLDYSILSCWEGRSNTHGVIEIQYSWSGWDPILREWLTLSFCLMLPPGTMVLKEDIYSHCRINVAVASPHLGTGRILPFCSVWVF